MRSSFTRDLSGWIISAVVNLTILGAMHFVVFRNEAPSEDLFIDSVVSQDELSIEQMLNSTQFDVAGTEGTTNNAMTALLPQVVNSQATAGGRVSATAVEDTGSAVAMVSVSGGDFALPETGEIGGDVAQTAKGGVGRIEGGAGAIMDRAKYEIRMSLKEHRTLVVWMFDASGSLKERRDAISERFENVYRQLTQDKEGIEGLQTAVMTYGHDVQFLTPEPVSDTAPLVAAVKKIENDESGEENVFTAVHMAASKWRNFKRSEGKKWNKLIFIITDEKGDDALGTKDKDKLDLESVIAEAKKNQFRVFCIGNAAVFGREKGLVHMTWTEGDNSFEEDIEVDQGPESAFPDGVQLPVTGGDWRKYNQMSSGFGPYALTRLCAETAGMYLITQDSQGFVFDRNVMRNYLPDYRPVRIQADEISKNGAKKALVEASELSYKGTLPYLEQTFPGYNDNALRVALTDSQKPAAEVQYRIANFHKVLSQGEAGRKTLKEPRWRAAYDLAMGRVCALRVRYEGYNRALANMKTNILPFKDPKNNMWTLANGPTIETGPEMRKLAEQANMYLKRVVDEHPGTPWAQIATEELQLDLGWKWTEFFRDLPGDQDQMLSDEDVMRVLFAEEEEQQRRRQQMTAPAQPKNRPKL